mgnify:CR=1 FL=1
MDFGRLVTAMVTPFDEALNINLGQIEPLVNYLLDVQQSDSLVVCGTTGEGPTLSDDEKLELISAVVRYVNGRCKVIAGTGSFDTAHSIHLTKLAEEAGVDGILLVTPYYSRPSQEGLYCHFSNVAEATKLPVMLYNIPKRSAINIEYKTMLRLAEIPNIVATKEAHGDLEHITSLVSGAPEQFRVYCGDDSLTLPMLSIGSYGVVSVASHVIGAEMKLMIEQYLKGEPAAAARTHAELLPVFKGLFTVPSPAPVKHALKLRGIDAGGVRLPLLAVTEEEGGLIESLRTEW